MPRSLSSDQLVALSSGFIQPAFFVQITFATETVYLWTGVGTTTVLGHDWLGVGGLLGISVTEDSSTIEAKGITLQLSAIDSTLLPEIMTDYALGAPVIIYLGLYSDGSLIDAPFVTWSGRTDQPTLSITNDKATIALACENRLIEMSNATNRRYTIEDQQELFPGDLGFMFVDGLQNITTYWGGFPMASNNV